MRPLATFLLLCCASGAVHADYDLGERDLSFGGVGAGCSTQSRPGDCAIAFDQAGSSQEDRGEAVLRTSAGLYVAVGSVAPSNPPPNQMPLVDIGLARVLRDGAADASFGLGGKRIHSLGYFDVTGAAIDAQDRILVAGRINVTDAPPSMDVAVARFTALGELDATFGTGGIATVDCGAVYEFGIDLAVDAAGRVLLLSQYTGEAGALPAGLCMTTLDASGQPIAGSPQRLEDTADAVLDGGAIDASGASPGIAALLRCVSANCAGPGVVVIYGWDDVQPTPPQALAFLDQLPFDGACSLERARLAGPIAVSADGTRRRLLIATRDVQASEYNYLVLAFDGTSPSISCLSDDVSPALFPRALLFTGDGSDDLYMLADYYGNDTISESVRMLVRDGNDVYRADDSFDGGRPRAVRVRGNSGLLLATTPAQTTRRALVDPGVPGDMPPLPQLVLAGTRQYSPTTDDSDFYLARLGSDAGVFADGMEGP